MAVVVVTLAAKSADVLERLPSQYHLLFVTSAQTDPLSPALGSFNVVSVVFFDEIVSLDDLFIVMEPPEELIARMEKPGNKLLIAGSVTVQPLAFV